MPKLCPELPDVVVRRLTYTTVKGTGPRQSDRIGEPTTALHPVGGVSGLLLQCRPPAPGNTIGARSWILRIVVGRERRNIGLGGYPEVSLSQARQKAREIKEQITLGIDPVEQKKLLRSNLIRQRAKAVTFADLGAEYILKKAAEFKTGKQKQKLEGHLASYAYPFIGKMLLSDIERAHIVAMLEPIWTTKTETATRVRLHTERILDLAGVKGLRSGDNPARWRGNLELSFPAPRKVAAVEHLSSLPYSEIVPFLSALRQMNTSSAKALEFIILTVMRSKEVRFAVWSEIDLSAKVWTIPAERMKGRDEGGREHKVPLSDQAVALLESLPRTSEYLFTNQRGGALSDVYISKIPKILGHDVTAHGFRSTFRTWAQEMTSYPDEVPELCLAHVNSDATRAAYARSQLIDKRRQLMQEWANYCDHGTDIRTAKVVNIGSGKA